ncbi:DUF3055 family protein, partial [Bacillus cereus]|uniref:SAV0927 family protein n=1 Tax=Bacillus cereus TaxID=1396 RepID=UPI00283D525B
MEERLFLADDTVATKTRFVSLMGENERHDLALLYSARQYGKTIVLDMQSNK